MVERNPLVVNITNKVNNDGDSIIVCGGARGSCKSGSLTSLFHQVDSDYKGNSRFRLPYQLLPKDFVIKLGEVVPRVVWRPRDFLKLITMSEHLPAKSAIIWDETGVEGDSREFLTLRNRLIKKTLETIRSRNLVIGLTAPTIKSFDVSFSRVATHYFKMEGVATAGDLPPKRFGSKNYSKGKIYLLETDPFKGKILKKYILFENPEEGRLRQLSSDETRYYFRKPAPELENPYKRLKNRMQTFWYKDYDKVLGEFDEVISEKEDEDKKGHNLKYLAKEFAKNPHKFYDTEKNKIVIGALIAEFNLPTVKAKELRDYVRFLIKKGEIKIGG